MAIQLRKIVISESVIAAELDTSSILLDLNTGTYFGLDEVGTWIWARLTAGDSPDDIAEQLLADYEVEPVQVRADLAGFLEHLIDDGLVQVADE